MLANGRRIGLKLRTSRSHAPMPTILSDTEIKNLLGTVIVNGDVGCIRPNAYVLRLGASGEFLNTGKEFDLSSDKIRTANPAGSFGRGDGIRNARLPKRDRSQDLSWSRSSRIRKPNDRPITRGHCRTDYGSRRWLFWNAQLDICKYG